MLEVQQGRMVDFYVGGKAVNIPDKTDIIIDNKWAKDESDKQVDKTIDRLKDDLAP